MQRKNDDFCTFCRLAAVFMSNVCPAHSLQEEPVSGGKPTKSQGSGLPSGANGCLTSRALERLCQARQARRAARRLREEEQQQQQQPPKVPSNLDILEQHTMEVLKRVEVGPLEEVRNTFYQCVWNVFFFFFTAVLGRDSGQKHVDGPCSDC